jgi:hypothetical protein
LFAITSQRNIGRKRFSSPTFVVLLLHPLYPSDYQEEKIKKDGDNSFIGSFPLF